MLNLCALCYEVFTNVVLVLSTGLVSTGFSTDALKKWAPSNTWWTVVLSRDISHPYIQSDHAQARGGTSDGATHGGSESGVCAACRHPRTGPRQHLDRQRCAAPRGVGGLHRQSDR